MGFRLAMAVNEFDHEKNVNFLIRWMNSPMKLFQILCHYSQKR